MAGDGSLAGGDDPGEVRLGEPDVPPEPGVRHEFEVATVLARVSHVQPTGGQQVLIVEERADDLPNAEVWSVDGLVRTGRLGRDINH